MNLATGSHTTLCPPNPDRMTARSCFESRSDKHGVRFPGIGNEAAPVNSAASNSALSSICAGRPVLLSSRPEKDPSDPDRPLLTRENHGLLFESWTLEPPQCCPSPPLSVQVNLAPSSRRSRRSLLCSITGSGGGSAALSAPVRHLSSPPTSAAVWPPPRR